MLSILNSENGCQSHEILAQIILRQKISILEVNRNKFLFLEYFVSEVDHMTKKDIVNDIVAILSKAEYELVLAVYQTLLRITRKDE